MGQSLLSQLFKVVLFDKGSFALEGFDELVVDGFRLTWNLYSALRILIRLFGITYRVVLKKGVVFFDSKGSGVAGFFQAGLALIRYLMLAFP